MPVEPLTMTQVLFAVADEPLPVEPSPEPPLVPPHTIVVPPPRPPPEPLPLSSIALIVAAMPARFCG